MQSAKRGSTSSTSMACPASTTCRRSFLPASLFSTTTTMETFTSPSFREGGAKMGTRGRCTGPRCRERRGSRGHGDDLTQDAEAQRRSCPTGRRRRLAWDETAKASCFRFVVRFAFAMVSHASRPARKPTSRTAIAECVLARAFLALRDFCVKSSLPPLLPPRADVSVREEDLE